MLHQAGRAPAASSPALPRASQPARPCAWRLPAAPAAFCTPHACCVGCAEVTSILRCIEPGLSGAYVWQLICRPVHHCCGKMPVRSGVLRLFPGPGSAWRLMRRPCCESCSAVLAIVLLCSAFIPVILNRACAYLAADSSAALLSPAQASSWDAPAAWPPGPLLAPALESCGRLQTTTAASELQLTDAACSCSTITSCCHFI